jgi:methionine S-methyltransferase
LDIKQFLHNCEESSTAAYQSLKTLLERLENPDTRKQASHFLTSLRNFYEECEEKGEFLEKYSFSFDVLTTQGENDEKGRLVLLQLPSIFTPEEWSFTFYEGLSRYPTQEFQGRVVIELGCGNGWISIALAQNTLLKKITGLDLNPRAVVCAKLNLYLNALSVSGDPLLNAEGLSLLDRVDFQTSDLLSAFKGAPAQVDRIIGCIPQVLNPDPSKTSALVSEKASDEFLHSLSNYCEKQGQVEDEFGLGLMARALEEAIEIIRPSAKLIFNLGGRPGKAVLEKLFTRRGFQVKTVWQTKVPQAADTEIETLVAIENTSNHRFEFFMSPTTDEPIGAKTAHAFAAQGGKIFHSLLVVEARPKNLEYQKTILQLARTPGFEGPRSSLDLTFSDDELAEEKFSFLARLAPYLMQECPFPYEKTEGILSLRRHLAEYFRNYLRIPLTAKSFVVAPSRADLLQNIQRIYAPRRVLCDRALAVFLEGETSADARAGVTSSPSTSCEIIELPHRADQSCLLIESLRPEVVICSLASFEARSTDALERLMAVCQQVRARLFLDISSYFELSSQPSPAEFLSRFSHSAMPDQVTLICGLVKNRLYSDMELGFLVSENAHLVENFTQMAELTYSRAPMLSQLYYDQILYDLLKFQMKGTLRQRVAVRTPIAENRELGLPSRSSNAEIAFSHPAFDQSHFAHIANPIRLDYGENELSPPLELKSALFEAFARQNLTSWETDPRPDICESLKRAWGIEISPALVKLGGGIAPLFYAVAQSLQMLGGTLIFPTGSYGYFVAASQAAGVQTFSLQTQLTDSFKVTGSVLAKALAQQKFAGPVWLFLNAPVVNPTGAVYAPSELEEIFDICHNHGAGVILDAAFQGLEFEVPKESFQLERYFKKPHSLRHFLMLGGVSKGISGGGLRFGYMAARDSSAFENLELQGFTPPTQVLNYALKKQFTERHLCSSNIHEISQRNILKQRAERLRRCLIDCGWTPLLGEGGLFMVARPTAFEGLEYRFESGVFKLSASNIHKAMAVETGMLINNDVWTGLPGYCRFVISVSEQEFEKGLQALKQFYQKLIASEGDPKK